MIVLGLDPGTARTGFGAIERTDSRINASLVECGLIETNAGDNLARRLNDVYQDVSALIKKIRPDQVAVEELFFFKNAKTVMQVSHSRGVILLACQRQRVPIFEYTPLQIKQALTSSGRASKEEVQRMVVYLLGLKKAPSPDDVADALAAAVCHLHSKNF